MIKLLRFVASAFNARVAYIDCDGCVLKKFIVPSHVAPEAWLDWWQENLQPTPVIWRRLALLYLLRTLGVRLVLWTNRADRQREVTLQALGAHARLFESMIFCDGQKQHSVLDGPVMEDDSRYVSVGRGNNLLVASL